MAVIGGFLVIAGVPFIAAVCLDALAMPRLARAALVAVVPAVLAAVLYSRSWGLDEIGVVLMLPLIALSWLLGFVFAPLLRGLWRFANRSAKPS